MAWESETKTKTIAGCWLLGGWSGVCFVGVYIAGWIKKLGLACFLVDLLTLLCLCEGLFGILGSFGGWWGKGKGMAGGRKCAWSARTQKGKERKMHATTTKCLLTDWLTWSLLNEMEDMKLCLMFSRKVWDDVEVVKWMWFEFLLPSGGSLLFS